MPPSTPRGTGRVGTDQLATIPTDGGPAYCRVCHTAVAVNDAYCPKCGEPRLRVNDHHQTVVTERVSDRPVIIEDVVEDVIDPGFPWPFVLLAGLAVVALMLALFLAADARGNGEPPRTTVINSIPPTVVTQAPAPVFVPSPQPAPIIVTPPPQQQPQQQQTTETTSAPTTTAAP